MIEQAKETYERFNTAYDIIMEAEANKKKLNKTTKSLLEIMIQEAFEIDSELRKSLPGLNYKLKEMLKKGYLKPKEEDISPFEPVTSELFYKNFWREVGKALKGN